MGKHSWEAEGDIVLRLAQLLALREKNVLEGTIMEEEPCRLIKVPELSAHREIFKIGPFKLPLT